jgi:hypothetical protein
MYHDRCIRTYDGVVHAPGLSSEGMILCNGRVAASQFESAERDSVVTCLWCLTRIRAPDLRWFKWGDGT